ncbi:MAG: FIG01121526: hypothetical protein [uncultured Quadrisphaera sp.]|uniref:DUF3027 domain-containing protein n=1 Tax=uncultured Quadrisphaera sp. TaxID=904978 RepID=A0A6J4PQJ4_9ACTN|nr:MAG: FIG01121526: hypothetical protein [uncultured Quadrisphaera sp.]
MPTSTSSPRARRPAKDAVGAAAVDLARAAAVEVAGEGQVGEHLGSAAEPGADRVVVHRFASTGAGYRGWAWTVVVARAPRAKVATVSEVVLLPAGDAVLAPSWLPWAERLQPGDVGPTDVLPRVADDPRLVQGYEATDVAGAGDADAAALSALGLGRARVLGPLGRAEAATRWYDGDAGPGAPSARAASAACASCGFFVPLSGSLRAVFGVCANDWSPDDGRVVSTDHGCGAHSETDVVVEPEPLAPPILDDEALEPVVIERPATAEAAPVVEPGPASGVEPEPVPVLEAEPVAEAAPVVEPEPVAGAAASEGPGTVEVSTSVEVTDRVEVTESVEVSERVEVVTGEPADPAS